MTSARTSKTLAFLALAVAVTAPALAQPHAIEHRLVPHTLSSGEVANPASAAAVLFSAVAEVAEAPWVRLTFRRVELGTDSFLRLTSLRDGAVQNLGSRALAQWGNTSAYFNGPAVRVELVGGARTAGNVVEVGDLYVGVVPTVPESQCGPTDDRVPSDEPERARLLDVGCTASIYTEESCFLTAGHCLSSSGLVDIVEFNVPPSNADGSINHPGPEDQYAVDVAGREFVNGGVGNDWGLFMVFPNSETGFLPFEAQGAHVALGSSNPPVGNTVNIVGYGVDSGTANLTQQVSFGPITNSTSSLLQYQADTEGGNSGSAVEWESTGEIVAIHTNGGCSVGGGGANSGTAITNAGLQAALADFCPTGGGGIPCGDVQSFQARCRATGGNTIQARVILADTGHAGEAVEISVDGVPSLVTIVGRRASFAQGGFSSGAHTVSLSDPAGCLPNIVVNCP